MLAHRHAILYRNRGYELSLSAPGDFVLGPAEDCDARERVADAGSSLYCLDRARLEALFVETPRHLDLTASPFLFLAQFQHATHVVRVPLADLPELAAEIRPVVTAPILVHSVGRCGSTLVSRAFGAVPDVCSLSEPDVFTQLTEWRCGGAHSREELTRLLETCTRLVCKPPAGRRRPDHYAIKFRAQCIELADLFATAFPAARQVYLTRAPLEWLESACRTLVPREVADDVATWRVLEEGFASVHPLLREFREPGQPRPLWQTWMLVWIANTEAYRRFAASGVRFQTVDFADLRANSEDTIRRLFTRCGIRWEGHWEDVVACLGRDSQDGSRLARTNVGSGPRTLPPTVRAGAIALLQSRGHGVDA